MDATRTAAGAERLRLAHLPTPLERPGRELGGPRIWVKRDDCTGLAGGKQDTEARVLARRGPEQERRHSVDYRGRAVQSRHIP